MSSIRVIFLAILLLPFCFKSISQEPLAFENISLELLENAHSVVRKDFFKITVKDSEKYVTEFNYAVTILNENSKEQLYAIPYDGHKKIVSFSAKLYDHNGVLLRSYSKKDAIDESAISGYSVFEDSRVLYHDITHSAYPYTVEFSGATKQEGYLDLPDFVFNNIGKSIEYAENRIITPDDFEIKFKSNELTIEPIIDNRDGLNHHTWKISDLPAIRLEPYAPHPRKLLPRVSIVPKEFKYENWSGTMDSWQTFGAFFSQLQEGRDEASIELKSKVNDLIKDLNTNQEKISVLYNYLQKNTRYVSVQLGIGGWQPFDANYVEKNEYGDCKALSNYMKSLLKIANIESYTAVIENKIGGQKELDSNFPEKFGNHMILYVPKENTWLECTSNNNPPNYIGQGNNNRLALLIKPGGGELISTPNYLEDKNITERQVEISLNNEGTAKIVGVLNLSGSEQEYFRYLAFNFSKEDQKKKFIEYFQLPNIKVEKLTIESNTSAPVVKIDFEVIANKFARKVGKRFVFSHDIFGDLPKVPKELSIRKYSVIQNKSYSKNERIIINLPDDYDISNIDTADKDIETPFGNYKQTMSIENKSLALSKAFSLNYFEGSPESYSQLRQFIVDINLANQSKLMLTKVIRP